MDKIKEKLHIGSSRRKSQPENDAYATSNTTHSTNFNTGPGHTDTTGSHGRAGHTIEDNYGTLTTEVLCSGISTSRAPHPAYP
jgi:hypothetical protein